MPHPVTRIQELAALDGAGRTLAGWVHEATGPNTVTHALSTG